MWDSTGVQYTKYDEVQKWIIHSFCLGEDDWTLYSVELHAQGSAFYIPRDCERLSAWLHCFEFHRFFLLEGHTGWDTDLGANNIDAYVLLYSSERRCSIFGQYDLVLTLVPCSTVRADRMFRHCSDLPSFCPVIFLCWRVSLHLCNRGSTQCMRIVRPLFSMIAPSKLESSLGQLVLIRFSARSNLDLWRPLASLHFWNMSPAINLRVPIQLSSSLFPSATGVYSIECTTWYVAVSQTYGLTSPFSSSFIDISWSTLSPYGNQALSVRYKSWWAPHWSI